MIKIDMTEHWIDGIPDKLELNCIKCGDKSKFDYKVKDEIWNKVIAGECRKDVVCLSCFDELAEEKGIDIGEHLEIVYFTGGGKTIELKPVKEYTYSQ